LNYVTETILFALRPVLGPPKPAQAQTAVAAPPGAGKQSTISLEYDDKSGDILTLVRDATGKEFRVVTEFAPGGVVYRFHDEKSKPTYFNRYAVLRIKYKGGLPVEERFEDENANPVETACGCAYVVCSYDEKLRKPTLIKYLKIDRTAVVQAGGWT